MIPVLFPYTFADNRTLERLYRFFASFIVLQPLEEKIPEAIRQAAQDGKIGVHTPVANDDERLAAAWREHLSWARMHGQNVLKALSLRPEKIPFFEEVTVSKIRQTIQSASDEPNEPERRTTPLYEARLFMLFAQRFDEEQAQLDATLLETSALEKQMLKALTGMDRSLSRHPQATGFVEGLTYMIDSRWQAWRRLAGAVPERCAFGVTLGRAAFEAAVEEGMAEPVSLLRLSASVTDPSPRFSADVELTSWLASILERPWNGKAILPPSPQLPDPEPGMSCLELYLLPNTTACHWLGCPKSSENSTRMSGSRHVLIGVLEG